MSGDKHGLWFRKVENFHDGIVSFQAADIKFVEEQVSIALQAYEDKGYRHQGPVENILGLVAELTFEEWIKKLGAIAGENYVWNERRVAHWIEDTRLWDFKLKNGETFEIGSARPTHTWAVMKAAKHKMESNYFVQIKVQEFNCKVKVLNEWYEVDARMSAPKKITERDYVRFLEEFRGGNIGKTQICGFDEVSTITKLKNGWQFSKKGEAITPYADGYIKPLDKLRHRSELITIVKSALGLGLDRFF